MGRVIFFTLFVSALLQSGDAALPVELEHKCLQCHKEQNIPSDMIYRRYLMKYSSKDIIKQRIFEYLKAPAKDISIMPPQFFSRFPLKDPSNLSDTALRKLANEFVEYYDIGKKIVILDN